MRTSLWPAGPTLELADNWQSLQALPDDPPDEQVFGYKFVDGGISLVMVDAIPYEDVMPLDQEEISNGRRRVPEVTRGQAGLINVAATLMSQLHERAPGSPTSTAS